MLKKKLFMTFCFFFALPMTKVIAQLIPDNTLGTESSVVTSVDELNDEINGGATRGSNLFHSFAEFNVGEGRGVDFVNPAGVNNIITRVTGNNVSNILGRLGVLGTANLFLINPNGIIFGEDARLDIGGSFYGSTADSVLFPDNVEFSATNPQAPLLTINVPIGLGLGNNPGTIINRSVVRDSTGDVVGLEVSSGETLSLVGGNINFEAGQATARGGRIELGGLSSAGTVTLNDNGSLSFPEDVERADVTLSNAADIDVRGIGGGSVTINARNVTIEAGDLGSSQIRAGITADSTSANAQAGDIAINATNNIAVDDSLIFNQVDSGAIGNAGRINITTGSLSLVNSSQIDASTFGAGNAGEINIDASDNVSISSESTVTSTTSESTVTPTLATPILVTPTLTISTSTITIDREQLDFSEQVSSINITTEELNIQGEGIFSSDNTNIETQSVSVGEEKARPEDILAEEAAEVFGLSIHRLIIPIQPLDRKITQTCTPGTKEARSEFIFTGRGGISPNTLDTLQLNPTTPNWVEFPSQLENISQSKLSTANRYRSPKIVEAQGWVRDENGEVILVAEASSVTPHDSWQKPRQCTHS